MQYYQVTILMTTLSIPAVVSVTVIPSISMEVSIVTVASVATIAPITKNINYTSIRKKKKIQQRL